MSTAEEVCSERRRGEFELVDLGQQAIVIGSGFGGAVAACRLAQAGFSPLVLERGRRYESNDFPALPGDGVLLPDLRRWSWEHEQGLCDVMDLQEVITFQAAGYGGGSLIYANVHLRAPDAVFDREWPEVYRNGGLSPYYDLVATMLEPKPIDEHEKPGPPMHKLRVLKGAVDRLGRTADFFYPPLTVRSEGGTNFHGIEQEACKRCGACVTGCPHKAKNTLDFNYLAVAERNGAIAKTQCEVLDIEALEGNRWSVECIDHLSARRIRFESPYVFLCAGSIHSTRLLARARLAKAAPAVQRLVGTRYHAGGGAAGVVFDTEEEVQPSVGPTITTTVAQWTENAGSFFLIQDGGYAKQLERLVGAFRAPLWLGRNRLTPRTDRMFPRADARQGAPLPSSPVDGVLDALQGGDFAKAVPHQLRARFPEFLNEVNELLLLPAVVDHTVDLCIQARHESNPVVRRFLPGSSVRRCLDWLQKSVCHPIQKWGVRRFFGTDEVIARHALSALLAQGNLRRDEVAERVLGYGSRGAQNRMMLLAMGRDAAKGQLEYDRKRQRLVADLDLYKLGPRYAEEEQLMADIARELGGELRTSPAWAFLGKPFSVHNQGGCPMSETAKYGVTDPDGKVYGCEGLYVCDGSILCTSVGVNPAATIAAIAERNVLEFIRGRRPNWPEGYEEAGALQYAHHRDASKDWGEKAVQKGWRISPPGPSAFTPTAARPIGIKFSERMQGFYSETAAEPTNDATYRELEIAGRPGLSVDLSLDVGVENLALFFEDMTHELALRGSAKVVLPSAEAATTHDVRGTLQLMVPRFKPYGIAPGDRVRMNAQQASDKHYRTVRGSPRPRSRRFMRYALSFQAHGAAWLLRGYKRIRDDAGIDAWRDTSSLFLRLYGPPEGATVGAKQAPVLRGAGVAHVALPGFLFDQLRSIEVGYLSENDGKLTMAKEPPVDPAQVVWATTTFATFFFGELQRVYSPEVKTAVQSLFGAHSNNVRRERPPPRR